MTHPAPHDTDTELAMLGSMWLRDATTRGLIIDALTPTDFYAPNNRTLFTAITAMHRRGDPMDPVLLRDELRHNHTDIVSQDIIAAITTMGPVWSVPAYVEILTRLSISRAVQTAALELAELAKAGSTEPGELVELARERFESIDVPSDVGASLMGLSTVEDFLAITDTTPAPWIVPGLLRVDWRCLLVAPEGVGKSTALRSIALAASAGVHPFAHTPITPVRTLIIDLENPDDAIAETAGPMSRLAQQVPGHDPDRAWIWRRPDGIELRSRSDRAAFHAVLTQVQPDLVCLGPLYKAYRPSRGESDEVAAGEVMAILDDARTRHQFALLMEHHAPKASGMAGRELVPYGSSLWLRWPELGLKLIPSENGPEGSLTVGRFRLDRMKNAWPERLDRSTGGWPWVGVWSKGMDR